MNFWTCFFILIGVLFLTAQLMRLIDFIERPASRAVSPMAGASVHRQSVPPHRRSRRYHRAA